MQFQKDFKDQRVLVTGHTGFKGSWLCMWLSMLGAKVSGLSLEPETCPNMFDVIAISKDIDHHLVDVRDQKKLEAAIAQIQPKIVFHLAAQPLVRQSYVDPINTFETNTMGTAYLLEALRQTPSVQAVLCITTDKVYHNADLENGFVESDALGGKDPYSASKSAAEMVVSGYRGLLGQRDPPLAVATARGGNVIGGGDWSEDRLIPDLVRAICTASTLTIRNPNATRPWQHVLCLCHGYLLLMQKLLRGSDQEFQSWNFGPSDFDTVPVSELLEQFEAGWALPDINYVPDSQLLESEFLKLSSDQSKQYLNWHPVWALQVAVAMTATWYKAYLEGQNMADVTRAQILQYNLDIAKNA